ncbi:MAG: caspase family protein [Planctomycetes bacterium]|nr:caspase family protein [Planctomycetota bacterium]
MCLASTIRRTFLPTLLGLLFVGSAGAQEAKTKEVAHLKVLLVADTSDPVLAKGVHRDTKNFTSFLANNIPKERYDLVVLTGESITPDQILAHYKNLKVGPDDGLLFYYSGHGSIRPGKGHTLELQKGKNPLTRSDVVAAMTAKKPLLAVLLTDCCSDRLGLTDMNSKEGTPHAANIPTAPTTLVRKLFFQTQGLVDITAATNDVALADDFRGGYFTNAICRIAGQNKDKALSWKEFHTAVAKETVAIHQDAIKKGIAPQLRKGQQFQEPALINVLLTGADAPARVAAVVSLVNTAEAELEVEYRWDASQPWLKKKIPANGKVSIGTWLPTALAKLPDMTVKIDGHEQTLTPNRFDKEGTPKFSDGKVYRLGAKKDDIKGRSRVFELDS